MGTSTFFNLPRAECNPDSLPTCKMTLDEVVAAVETVEEIDHLRTLSSSQGASQPFPSPAPAEAHAAQAAAQGVQGAQGAQARACQKRRNELPLEPSPTVSVKSGSAKGSPFRLSVFSTSTDRSLPGDGWAQIRQVDVLF